MDGGIAQLVIYDLPGIDVGGEDEIQGRLRATPRNHGNLLKGDVKEGKGTDILYPGEGVVADVEEELRVGQGHFTEDGGQRLVQEHREPDIFPVTFPVHLEWRGLLRDTVTLPGCR